MEMEIKMQIMVVEEEMGKPWKTVNNNKKKVNKNQILLHRPWDALPSLALLNIIRNLNFKDRFASFAFVCKAWNNVISDDPRCWSSMVPQSVSPDDAFIKEPVYSVQVNLPSKLLYRRDRPVALGGKSDVPSICPGVSHFRTLIKKSSSSGSLGSSTITSLYLDPFHFAYPNNESLDHDEILHLIAHCCPNLKHISFHGFYFASIEAVLEVFHRCKKIELIDFSDSGYADSEEVIEVLGNCLPHLRGIRMAMPSGYSIDDAIATHLPRIKLLAFHCYEAWYCPGCEPPRRPRPFGSIGGQRLCLFCYDRPTREAEAQLEEAYLENLHLEKYPFPEPKKEVEYYYYVSILNEKKKKTRRNHAYVLRTTMGKNKKEVSFILKMKIRKKRDKHDYQDYYVQPLL